MHAVDHCIVMGDLNFRVQMPVDDALAAIARYARTSTGVTRVSPNVLWHSNDLEALLERDELRHAMRAEQCFVDFAEPRIRFPPSYKLDPMRSLTGQRYAVESRPCWYDQCAHRWTAHTHRPLCVPQVQSRIGATEGSRAVLVRQVYTDPFARGGL